MATELSPVVVATPAAETVITPVVHKSRLGRIYDAASILITLLAFVMEGLGTVDWVALGLTPQRATLAAMVWSAIRLALTFRPVRLVDVKADPAPGGQP